MIPMAYPDRDLQVILETPPSLRPFPVVVDADELIREVTYRARRGREPLLFSLGKFGLGRLYASEVVRIEVERNLPVYAGADAALAELVFQRDYLSRIRWIRMPDRAGFGFGYGEEGLAAGMAGILDLHAADAPTAEIALHCAPCFVLSGNSKHLHAAGFGDGRTREALIAAANKAQLEFVAMFGEACAEALAVGVWNLASRGAGYLRRSPLLSMLALFGAFAVLRHPRHRQQLRTVGSSVFEHGCRLFLEALDRHTALMAELTPSLFKADEVSDSVKVARVLSRYPDSLAAESIAARIGSDRASVLGVLHNHPAFQFWPGRGWSLGYHLDPL